MGVVWLCGVVVLWLCGHVVCTAWFGVLLVDWLVLFVGLCVWCLVCVWFVRSCCVVWWCVVLVVVLVVVFLLCLGNGICCFDVLCDV